MAKNIQRTLRLLFKCQPCDEINGRDRTYTRSYDLIAHLVNTHDQYPISIKHNATYLPLKADRRPATAEEILKYKDANKHGRKRAVETASKGKASVSGTALVPEGSAGKGKRCEPRRVKGEPAPAVDQGGKKERGQASKGRDEKRTGSRKDSSHDETRKARETADEKDLADDEADKREYAALKNKMEVRRIAREIQTAHDTLASLRAEQDGVSGKTRTEKDHPGTGVAIAAKTAIKKSRVTRPGTGTVVSESEVNAAKGINRRAEESEKTKSAEIEGGEQEDT